MTDQDRDDADEWEDISGDGACLVLRSRINGEIIIATTNPRRLRAHAERIRPVTLHITLKPDAPLPPQLRVIVRHLGPRLPFSPAALLARARSSHRLEIAALPFCEAQEAIPHLEHSGMETRISETPAG